MDERMRFVIRLKDGETMAALKDLVAGLARDAELPAQPPSLMRRKPSKDLSFAGYSFPFCYEIRTRPKNVTSVSRS